MAISYSIAQAKIFGTTTEIEAYFGAILIIGIIIELTQTGKFLDIILPLYIEAKVLRGYQIANQIFSVLLNWILIFSISLFSIFYFLIPFAVDWFVPGFTSETKKLVVQIVKIFLFFGILDIIKLLFGTFLNAEKIFGKVEIINFSNNLISFIFLIVFHAQWGIWALVYGQITGKILNFLLMIWAISKTRYKYSLILSQSDFNHWNTFKNFGHTLLYLFSTQFYSFVLSAALSLMPQGLYAIYNFVTRLFLKLRGTIGRPIGVVYFTEFSELINSNLRKLNQSIREAVNYSLLVSCYLFLFTLVVGQEGLMLIWKGDNFEAGSIQKAYWLLLTFMVGFLFSNAATIYRQTVLSHKLYKEQFVGAALLQFIKAGLLWLIVPTYGFFGLIISILLMPLSDFTPIIILQWKLPNIKKTFNWGLFCSRMIIILLIAAPLQLATYVYFDNLFFSESMLPIGILFGVKGVIASLFVFIFIKYFDWMEKELIYKLGKKINSRF